LRRAWVLTIPPPDEAVEDEALVERETEILLETEL
jgi:hypothetical protein